MQSAAESIDNIAAQADSALLMCSLGKDSLVVLDLIYPKFKRIVCVFMYFVKGLDHIQRWIDWVKAKYPRVEFIEIPHWNLTHILKSGMYCVPQPKLKTLMLADVIRGLRTKYGIHYVFLGMKKADGLNRNVMLRGYEAKLYENNGLVYPLAEWTQKHILAYMKQRHLPQPVRYSLAASSGLGFNIECMTWMRQHYPQDLKKIYEVFPFCERMLWELEYKQNNTCTQTDNK